MGLLIPGGPDWAYCSTNLTGTPDSSPGTSITAGTSNANGSTVALFTALTHDVEYLILQPIGFWTAAAVNRTMIDIMIDPAGGSSWATTPLIADLICGGWANVTGAGGVSSYHFPLRIPAGASLGARARCSHTVAATGATIMATVFGGNRNPGSWWAGSKVTAIGTTGATSSGTSITPGATGAYSAWTSVGSTLADRAGAVQWAIQMQASAATAKGYYFEFGAGSTRIGPPHWAQVTTSELAYQITETGPLFVDIPLGTQIQARGTCSTTVPDTFDVAAYVVS